MDWYEDRKNPLGKALHQHLFGGFGPEHPVFDPNRLDSGTCQLCGQPCAIRCSNCHAVLEGSAAACPTCGEFYDGKEPPEEETHRMGLAYCPFHASNEIQDN